MGWIPDIDYDNPLLDNIFDGYISLEDGIIERETVIKALNTAITVERLASLGDVSSMIRELRNKMFGTFGFGGGLPSDNIFGWLKIKQSLAGKSDAQIRALSYYKTASDLNGLATDGGWASYNEFFSWYFSSPLNELLNNEDFIRLWLTRYYTMVNLMKYAVCKQHSNNNSVFYFEQQGIDPNEQVRYTWDLTGLGIKGSFEFYTDASDIGVYSLAETFSETDKATSAWYNKEDLHPRILWVGDFTGTNGFSFI